MRGNPGVLEKLPDELGMSYPVPLIRQNDSGKQIVLIFFYFNRTGFPPGPPDAYAPKYISDINLETREIVEFHSVTSKDFGIIRDDKKSLGKFQYINNYTMDEFLQFESRFYQLYDQILPYYIKSESVLSGKQAQQVNEFLQLFSMIVPKIMQPYYKALNPAFFDWLAQSTTQ